MKNFVVIALVIVTGCKGGAATPVDDKERARIDAAVSRYADAALRAEQSKKAATDDHPVAVSEMKTNEDWLRDECKTDAGKQGVRASIERRREDLDRKRKIAPPGEMEKLDFQFRALGDLRLKLGV